MESKASGFFDEAVKNLREANDELCRPEEDVVSYMVCKNSQYAIEKYFKGYLLENGIEPSKGESIKSLYDRCVKLENKFKELDLNEFTCKGYIPDSRSCSDTVKVSKCFETAEQVDQFLRRERVLV